jgi:pyridoxine 5-phosphate synthase
MRRGSARRCVRLLRNSPNGNRATAEAEYARIVRGAAAAAQAGLEVHAGHGLDFLSAEKIAGLPEIAELNIGHFLIGEAIFDGLDAAVRKMRAAMQRGRADATKAAR